MPKPATVASRLFAVIAALIFVFAVVMAVIAIVGLLGRWNAWADVVNQFAGIWLGLCLLGLVGVFLTRKNGLTPWTGALICVAVLVQVGLAGPDWLAGLAHAGADANTAKSRFFTVMTFNTWNESPDRGAVIARVIASDADVVTLQEALGVEQLSSAALSAVYPYQATCDDWWGCEILILSKRPILDHHYAAPAPTGSGGTLWAVWVTTTTRDGRRVRVLSTHLAWPTLPAFRKSQVDRLAEIVRGLRGSSLIVTGDFNSGGASFAMRDQDARLPSLDRRTHAALSWPAALEGTNWLPPFPFLAIDQVYATRDWTTVDVKRLPRSGSDHYPILVTLAHAQHTG